MRDNGPVYRDPRSPHNILKLFPILLVLIILVSCRDITPAGWESDILEHEPLKRATAILLVISIIFGIWLAWDVGEFVLIFQVPAGVFGGTAALSVLTMLIIALVTYGIGGEPLTLQFSFVAFVYITLAILITLGWVSFTLIESFSDGFYTAGNIGKMILSIISIITSGIGLAFTIKDLYGIFFPK